MTTSGRPAYGNLAGHPFGVNAKWLQTNIQAAARFNKPWSNAQDRRHSIDAHPHDWAGSMTLSFLPIKDGNTSIMCNHYQIAFLLPDLQQ